ncbi:EamA family transporter [Psychrobacter phenylpyruvicus]|uniref:Probable amino-acid metabolite efflux pump n=1 Tax=Psychrobacter phenylpyruvicus TaxID=29432 RepID=A0A379LL27_9GAMM|nr:EamA family transporter [Psychrobacter phenylpyruvicus]SUD90825.1 Probable amino-acid metabolite efflux pump [Psychrobacter phenylpyruvicus]
MNLKEKLILLTIVLVWGANFMVIRWGLEDMHPFTFIFLRFLFTAIPLVFFLKKPDVSIGYVVIYGFALGIGVWGLVFLAVYQGMPSGMSSLILQTSPFLTILIALAVFKEVLATQQAVGVFVAFIGLLIICLFKSDGFSITSLLLVLLASVFMTLSQAIIKLAKPKDVVSFTVWSSLFIPLPVLALALLYANITATDLSVLMQWPSLKGWIVVLFEAFIITIVGYSIFNRLITKHGLAVVTPYTLLIPISGLFFGWLAYDETLSEIEVMGSLLILAGLTLLTLKFSRRTKAVTIQL